MSQQMMLQRKKSLFMWFKFFLCVTCWPLLLAHTVMFQFVMVDLMSVSCVTNMLSAITEVISASMTISVMFFDETGCD